MAIEQADLLISEGADPKRILIGHMGGSADIKYHLAILERVSILPLTGWETNSSQRMKCVKLASSV